MAAVSLFQTPWFTGCISLYDLKKYLTLDSIPRLSFSLNDVISAYLNWLATKHYRCKHQIPSWKKKGLKNKQLLSEMMQQLTHLFEARRTNTCRPIFKECGLCSKYVYMDPKCKIALITGGTSGIGFSAAQELLCNDLYRVVLTDMDTCKGKEAVEKLNSQYGEHKACFMQLDTYKEKHFCDVIQKVIKIFGNLDILINNPGIPRKKTWEEEVNAKVMSTIRGTMIGSELMSKQKLRRGGVIINLASALALENFPGAPIYVSSNNGIIGFSKAWGATQNYLTSSVRVISMCPGMTEGLIIENTAAPEDKEVQASVAKLPAQNASSVGRGIVYLVQHAPSGTVWFVEGGVLYRGRIPHRLDYSEKIRYV